MTWIGNAPPLREVPGDNRGYQTITRPDWLPRQSWPFELRALRARGRRVHVVDAGTGPVVLLVHAGFWSFVWRDVITRLAPHCRCIALDFPESGLSATTGQAPTLGHHSGVLREVIESLELGDLTLVFHDLGGAIALDAIADAPDRVRALVAVNTFAWVPDAKLRRGLRVIGSAPVRVLDHATNMIPRMSSTRFGVGRRFDPLARRAFLGPFRDRRKRDGFHRLLADAGRSDELLARAEQTLGGPLADRPAASVFGERNDPFGFQARWRDLFPDGEHHIVAGGHHFPMNDDPDLVADVIHRLAARSGVASRGRRPA